MDIKGLTRKNYWDYPLINPLLLPDTPIDTIDAFAHEELSADCHRLFVEGHTDVIFEYAKSDISAWREPWVIAQVERWRLENTSESRARCERLWRAYFDTQGSRSMQTTVRVIAQDQQIFKAAINIKRQYPQMTFEDEKNKRRGAQAGIYSTLVAAYPLGRDSVEAIYKLYKTKVDEVMGTTPPRLLAQHLLPKKQHDTLQGAFQLLGQAQNLPIPETPLLPTWTAVFRWLDDMIERLHWLGG